jgi:chemotaxis protein MotB
MARKKKHEEHTNTEAWAIPYGDLVTLLFALFTVMYSVSSVNEGKFRILSDSIIAAFHGAPKSIRPVNIGEKEPGKGGDKNLTGITPTALLKLKNTPTPADIHLGQADPPVTPASASAGPNGALLQMQREVQGAMQSLIDAKLVTVSRENMWLEIQINTDILFASGSGEFSPVAEPVLDELAQVLKRFPNPIRVEGHTDDRPIKTAAFPSNWELSAARAASVVHQFTQQGVDPLRLEIVGFGEFHPRRPNDTAEGRNANRRVVVLVADQEPQAAPDTGIASPAAQSPASQTPASQSPASQSPASQSPASQSPASQSPASQSPASQSPGGAPGAAAADAGGAADRPSTEPPALKTTAVAMPANSRPNEPSNTE